MKTKIELINDKLGIQLEHCGRWFTLRDNGKIIAKSGNSSEAYHAYWQYVKQLGGK